MKAWKGWMDEWMGGRMQSCLLNRCFARDGLAWRLWPPDRRKSMQGRACKSVAANHSSIVGRILGTSRSWVEYAVGRSGCLGPISPIGKHLLVPDTWRIFKYIGDSNNTCTKLPPWWVTQVPSAPFLVFLSKPLRPASTLSCRRRDSSP